MKMKKRKRIFSLIGDLYTMRSSAVHTGIMRSKIRKESTQNVLSEGFSITTETVQRIITNGEPKWDRVIFG
jgi:hypothetical protein